MNLNKVLNKFFWVWLLFIANGMTAIFILPLWGGFDEWLHYSYVSYLTRTGKIPLQSDYSIPEEVVQSLKAAPGDFPERTGFTEFWKLPESERTNRIFQMRTISNRPDSVFVMSSWQAQHPPLYYAFLSPFYRMFKHHSVLRSTQILRLVSLFLVSLSLIPLYFLFRFFFDEKESLLGLTLFSCAPAAFILFGHLTNDCMAMLLLSTLIFLILRQFNQGITLFNAVISGIVLGLGLLSKLYLLTLLPAALIVYFYGILKSGEKRKAILNLVLFLVPAFLIAGGWFLYNLKHYGTWNPTVHSVVAKDFSLMRKWSFVPLVNWKSFFVSMVIGHLWSGNWSFVTFPDIVYKLYAVAGLILFVLYLLWAKNADRIQRRNSFILVLISATFLAAEMKHQLDIRIAGNFDSMGGWYWTVLLPTHIILAMLAVKNIAGKKFILILAVLILFAFLVAQYAATAMLIPYYSGLLTKQEIAVRFINLFPIFESLRRISNLNHVPVYCLPIFWTAQWVLFIKTILYVTFYEKMKPIHS